jgi:hypothetical protein
VIASTSPLRRRFAPDAPAFLDCSPILGLKPIENPPPPKKKQQRDESILDSVEESSLRRPTVLWKQGRPGGRSSIVQVGQDSLNDGRIFNASVRRVDNDPDQSGAVLIVCNPSPINHRAL